MAMSEEQLIVLVQQYKHLYDISDSNYHNNLIKDNSWEEIGKILSTTGNEKHIFINYYSLYDTNIIKIIKSNYNY